MFSDGDSTVRDWVSQMQLSFIVSVHDALIWDLQAAWEYYNFIYFLKSQWD